MTTPISISSEHLNLLIVSAFRYALGRKTYVVGSTVGIIHQHWKDLSEDTRDLLLREITEYKEKFGNLGHQCDEQEWLTVVQRLIEEI